MLTALSSISDQKVNPTDQTMQKIKQVLDYAASHPDSVLKYQASEIVLAGHSDALHLSGKKSHIRAGGYFFMSNNITFSPNNGAVFAISIIIKAAMSLLAESELGALFINCKEAIPSQQALEEMGHKQPSTPMKTDNTTTHGGVTNNISSKRQKSMDMQLHWLRCRST